MYRMRRRLISWCAACALIVSAGCDYSARMELHNRTFQILTPYPVNADLEPPRRVADPANNLGSGDFVVVDPAGFNPAYYQSGVNDEAKANGFYVGLNLIDADPLQVQYKVYHYRVPPGEAGSDPDLQPILLQSEVVEVENVDIMIVVREVDTSPGGWTMRVSPR